MTETLAVDYSFSRPSPATIKAHGYTAVGRYLGGTPDKQLTKAEAATLHAAGLGIWLVFESTADRAKAGRAAGVADAKTARSKAAALGYPAACPIFFAVDFDAAASTVSAYFDGVKSVLGDRAGVYGGINVVGLADWAWQTTAWSGGRLSPHAHLYQRVKMTNPVPGCDENVVCRPIPVWGPKGVVELAPPTAPKPTPAPAPKPTPTPRPATTIRLGFANMNWGTSQAKDDNIVADLIHLGCLLLGLVEAKVDNVRHMVPAGWKVAQSLANLSRKGSAAAWAPAVRIADLPPLRPGVRPGRAKMLPRWLRIVDINLDGHVVRIIICHWPPARFRFLWPAFTAAVKFRLRVTAAGRSGRWVVLADYNMPIAKAGKTLGGTAYGTGIVGAVVGRGIKASLVEIDSRIVTRHFTDHPGVIVDIKVR